MINPSTPVEATVEEVQQVAAPLGLTWQLRYATVAVVADDMATATVTVDGDTVAILATNLLGTLAPGGRVAVISLPPAGLYIMGWAGPKCIPTEDFETSNDTTTSQTYVPGTAHTITFTAPPSGAVYITFMGWVGSTSIIVSTTAARTLMTDEVYDGPNVNGNVFLAGSDDRAVLYFVPDIAVGFKYDFGSLRHMVDGLTPGATYTVATLFRDNGAVGATAAINDRRLLVEPVL